MAIIQRIRVELTGLIGLPGVATYYAVDAAALAPQLVNFWNAFTGYFPAGMGARVQSTGDIIEATTGALTGTWSGSANAPFVMTGSGNYSAPSGAVINWLTDTVVDGHRLRGKSYMVPLAALAYDSDGTLTSDTQASFSTICTALVTAANSNFVIWHRPRAATATVTARSGSFAFVTGFRVPDKAAVLRSRRD